MGCAEIFGTVCPMKSFFPHPSSHQPHQVPAIPKLVLLDRDGVINEDLPTSVLKLEEFHLIPGSLETIVALNMAGLKVAVVTNQGCVGRGELSHGGLGRLHDHLQATLASLGGGIDHIFACTDAVASARRKPAPGMLVEALDLFGVAPWEAVMVGDHLVDYEAALGAGCGFVLVRTGKGAEHLETHRLSARSRTLSSLTFQELCEGTTSAAHGHVDTAQNLAEVGAWLLGLNR